MGSPLSLYHGVIDTETDAHMPVVKQNRERSTVKLRNAEHTDGLKMLSTLPKRIARFRLAMNPYVREHAKETTHTSVAKTHPHVATDVCENNRHA